MPSFGGLLDGYLTWANVVIAEKRGQRAATTPTRDPEYRPPLNTQPLARPTTAPPPARPTRGSTTAPHTSNPTQPTRHPQQHDTTPPAPPTQHRPPPATPQPRPPATTNETPATTNLEPHPPDETDCPALIPANRHTTDRCTTPTHPQDATPEPTRPKQNQQTQHTSERKEPRPDQTAAGRQSRATRCQGVHQYSPSLAPIPFK